MERMPYRTEDPAARLRRGVVAVAAAAAFVVGACASPGGGATTAPATQSTPTTAPASAAATTDADSISLEVAEDATLGYVTGRDGMALYFFKPDTGTTSNCNDDCAKNWPPLTVDDADDVAAGGGVTGALGTITRGDGSMQVTLAGHPLYYFAGDKAAGDVNGQGLNDVWFLAAPDGTMVTAAGGPAPSPTKCGGPACY
jgi:predicted lipoprotein with Yx(FWY)xxD motif